MFLFVIKPRKEKGKLSEIVNKTPVSIRKPQNLQPQVQVQPPLKIYPLTRTTPTVKQPQPQPQAIGGRPMGPSTTQQLLEQVRTTPTIATLPPQLPPGPTITQVKPPGQTVAQPQPSETTTDDEKKEEV